MKTIVLLMAVVALLSAGYSALACEPVGGELPCCPDCEMSAANCVVTCQPIDLPDMVSVCNSSGSTIQDVLATIRYSTDITEFNPTICTCGSVIAQGIHTIYVEVPPHTRMFAWDNHLIVTKTATGKVTCPGLVCYTEWTVSATATCESLIGLPC